MAHYATIEQKAAPLSCDFARPFLERHFSAAVVAALYEAMPRYSRGPRKGQIKGFVHWLKCSRGGWYKTAPGYGHGYVMTPGSHKIRVHLDRDPQSRCFLDLDANATDESRIAAMRERIADLGLTSGERAARAFAQWHPGRVASCSS